MHLSQLLTSALTGAIATAALIALADPPRDIAQVPQQLQTVQTTRIYTCDKLPMYDPEENPAIRELRDTCRVSAEALLMIEQWQNNPQANIVYEPE